MAPQELQQLAAEAEIRRVLAQYCRALDRMDKNAAYGVWHSDGSALYHDIFEGSGHGFVDWVWQAHAAMERHSHQIAQSWIAVDGDSARSESYVTVCLWTLPDADGRQQEIVGRGRYLDRWACRKGRWAIEHREHVLDMQTIHPLGAEAGQASVKGYVSAVSSRDSSDPSFNYC
ncbi:nuclear transport factor 2 family protein [Parahaliea aestuarii]|uniref:Nuclear transport factor 2 family protein n=1 Tax=Parahaliea aestuarii TaxID=1852021 RepID=A0A5C8ZTD3_9GAMM|nr:nuclear transport factor 2 family protein [Parahaliea aestuarii]TXS91695.1 nuclear transport factor 2 family protein [Parahaliea aestuarii]